MSEQKFIRYGDRTMPLEPGMTLEQARELMARHFPELADPKIETVKKDDKVTYVFSKKAGHKGKGGDQARVLAALNRVGAAEIIDSSVLRAVTTGQLRADADVNALQEVVAQLRDESSAVRATADALLDAPMARALTGSVL